MNPAPAGQGCANSGLYNHSGSTPEGGMKFPGIAQSRLRREGPKRRLKSSYRNPAVAGKDASLIREITRDVDSYGALLFSSSVNL